MALADLFNTTMTRQAESVTLSDDQRVETHGAAEDAIPARIEHLSGLIQDGFVGEAIQNLVRIYFPAGTTTRPGDIWTDTADSVEYKVLTKVKAYGMSEVDHIEVDATELP